ncbi:MAG TPA: acetoacetate decarboxylase family protein [Armatimonadota bacterium]|jgi:hypothetical protein
MSRSYAEPGTVPQFGEIWRAYSDQTFLMGLQLVDIDQARAWVPDGLKIVPILPGKTLGSLLLASYGAGSTLAYHECIVMPALVAFGGSIGLWVSHLYVDDERSCSGGRLLGYPKEMATFDWQEDPTHRVTISQGDATLCTIASTPTTRRFPFWLGGPTLSLAGDDAIFSASRFHAHYGRTRLAIKIPPDSPLAASTLTAPTLAFSGSHMHGNLAEFARRIGRLPVGTPIS